MEEAIKEKILPSVDNDNRCPDFDEDCMCVKDHLKCFLGLPATLHGQTVCFGQAKGCCPFIHADN